MSISQACTLIVYIRVLNGHWLQTEDLAWKVDEAR